MIGDWLSYRLSDFVMFSALVYDRQVALYNREMAGLQVAAVLIGAGLLWQTVRPHDVARRAVPAVLGLLWLWVAWGFLWQRYGDINLIARWAAPAFALQGLALMACSINRDGLALRSPRGTPHVPATGLLALTLILYPLFAPATGRPVLSAEFFGLMPDPTALGTLCLLALSKRPVRFALLVVPAVWCALSASTLWVLESRTAWVVAITAACALLLAFRQSSVSSGPDN